MTLPSATAFEAPKLSMPSPSQQREYAASRQNKWFKPQKQPVKRVEAVTPIKRVYLTAKPERVWMCQQDSHMAAYYEWKGNEPLGFLKLRCRELELDVKRMTGMTRKAGEVDARGLLMVEVKLRFPEMSLPAIGKLFGGRDHTTILHFLHKHGIREAPRPRAAPLYQDTIRTMFFDGALFKEIAAAIGRSTSTVSNFVKENGWTRATLRLDDQAEKIRSMYMEGKPTREIGPAVGFSHVHVASFIRKQGWSR